MRIIFQQPRPDKKSERRGISFFPPLSAEGRARPGHARARPGAPGAPRPVRPGLDHDPDRRRCRKLPGKLKPNDGLGTAFCFSSAESLSLTGRPAIWFPQNSTIYNSGAHTHTRARHGSGRVQGAGGGAPKVQVGEATALPLSLGHGFEGVRFMPTATRCLSVSDRPQTRRRSQKVTTAVF